jgi:hypothetical protein
MWRCPIEFPANELCAMIVDTFDHQLPIARANINDIVRMRDDPEIILYAHMPCEDCSHEEMQLMHILTAEDWDLIERFSYEPTVTNEHALIKVYMRFNEALDDIHASIFQDVKLPDPEPESFSTESGSE